MILLVFFHYDVRQHHPTPTYPVGIRPPVEATISHVKPNNNAPLDEKNMFKNPKFQGALSLVWLFYSLKEKAFPLLKRNSNANKNAPRNGSFRE